jgi:hypothetical protein
MSQPYGFLNLLRIISAIDLDIKRDLDRQFTKLPVTPQATIKTQISTIAS